MKKNKGLAVALITAMFFLSSFIFVGVNNAQAELLTTDLIAYEPVETWYKIDANTTYTDLAAQFEKHYSSMYPKYTVDVNYSFGHYNASDSGDEYITSSSKADVQDLVIEIIVTTPNGDTYKTYEYDYDFSESLGSYYTMADVAEWTTYYFEDYDATGLPDCYEADSSSYYYEGAAGFDGGIVGDYEIYFTTTTGGELIKTIGGQAPAGAGKSDYGRKMRYFAHNAKSAMRYNHPYFAQNSKIKVDLKGLPDSEIKLELTKGDNTLKREVRIKSSVLSEKQRKTLKNVLVQEIYNEAQKLAVLDLSENMISEVKSGAGTEALAISRKTLSGVKQFDLKLAQACDIETLSRVEKTNLAIREELSRDNLEQLVDLEVQASRAKNANGRNITTIKFLSLGKQISSFIATQATPREAGFSEAVRAIIARYTAKNARDHQEGIDKEIDEIIVDIKPIEEVIIGDFKKKGSLIHRIELKQPFRQELKVSAESRNLLGDVCEALVSESLLKERVALDKIGEELEIIVSDPSNRRLGEIRVPRDILNDREGREIISHQIKGALTGLQNAAAQIAKQGRELPRGLRIAISKQGISVGGELIIDKEIIAGPGMIKIPRHAGELIEGVAEHLIKSDIEAIAIGKRLEHKANLSVSLEENISCEIRKGDQLLATSLLERNLFSVKKDARSATNLLRAKISRSIAGSEILSSVIKLESAGLITERLSDGRAIKHQGLVTIEDSIYGRELFDHLGRKTDLGGGECVIGAGNGQVKTEISKIGRPRGLYIASQNVVGTPAATIIARVLAAYNAKVSLRWDALKEGQREWIVIRKATGEQIFKGERQLEEIEAIVKGGEKLTFRVDDKTANQRLELDVIAKEGLMIEESKLRLVGPIPAELERQVLGSTITIVPKDQTLWGAVSEYLGTKDSKKIAKEVKKIAKANNIRIEEWKFNMTGKISAKKLPTGMVLMVE